MVRLRDNATGVVVNVDDVLAERLGAGYTPVAGKPKVQPKPRAKRAPAKGSKKD